MTSDSAGLQILIVGGGLAGLAAASFLREQNEVTVLERSNLDFSRNDYVIGVAPNTHRLLLEQGIEDSHLKATDLTYIWACNAEGKLIRETLSESLARFGATTIFTRGDTYSGDLIIGADGINSVIRAAVLSTHSGSVDVAGGVAAVPSGLAAYLCTIPKAMLCDDPVLAFQTGEKSGMAAFLGTHPRKRVLVVPADSENFQIVAYHPEDRWVEQFMQSRSSIIKDVPAERAVEDFLDFHPSVQKMLANATALDVWRIRDLDQLPVWHSGKAILIGDAAHAVTPHSGHGFNIAFEDGEALGYFLWDITSAAQVPAALANFETIHIPRAHMVQLASRHIGGLLSEEERKKIGQFDYGAFITKVHGCACYISLLD
ncbi:FAD/NAD(P)-binding domain-containing protein [Mycena sanguinolenta]|uniref:FAD/NAD(P)-binding domain-containing protein n=1 Tax=Mycena sanguinolenta TaxID=230812 RepID=A0A8H6XMA3_9AGAR|nr:FAD/NAD(P)-binding domain-containing protein [Mycena sanguinolenta]